MVGLDVGRFRGLGTRQSALALLEALHITYPAGTPSDQKALVNYSVSGLPSTIFFDGDGAVLRRWDGAISERQMEAVVEEALGAS